MEIKVFTKPADFLNIDELERFILDTSFGNFFQSRSIFEFYSLINNYNPVLLIVEEKGNIYGSILAVIQKEKGFIKGNLSGRCIVYGGPVVKDNNEEVTDLLLKELVITVQKKSIYIEFRNLFDISKDKDAFRRNGFIFKEHFNFIVDITDPEDNFKKLNDNRKRQIKKSIKAGAKITEPENLEDVKAFYLILKDLYKEKVKKPLPGFNFFEQFYNTPALGKYLFVKYEGKVIGGIMCPIHINVCIPYYSKGKIIIFIPD